MRNSRTMTSSWHPMKACTLESTLHREMSPTVWSGHNKFWGDLLKDPCLSKRLTILLGSQKYTFSLQFIFFFKPLLDIHRCFFFKDNMQNIIRLWYFDRFENETKKLWLTKPSESWKIGAVFMDDWWSAVVWLEQDKFEKNKIKTWWDNLQRKFCAQKDTDKMSECQPVYNTENG